MNYIGNYIRKFRGDMSLREFAEKCGISHAYLDSIEKGRNPRTGKTVSITVDTLKKISKAMGLTINELLIQSGEIKLENIDNSSNSITGYIDIPVFRSIISGININEQRYYLESIGIPKKWTRGNKNFFGYLITDETMKPKYNKDDIVIFEETNDFMLADNKDCLIMIGKNKAVFRYITITNEGISIIPLNLNNNDNIKPIFYNNEDIEKIPIKLTGIAKERRTKL